MTKSILKSRDFSKTSGVSKMDTYYSASSVFWFENNDKMRTVISFLNYWFIKNNTDIYSII